MQLVGGAKGPELHAKCRKNDRKRDARDESSQVQAACEAGDYATSLPTKTATKSLGWRPTFDPQRHTRGA